MGCGSSKATARTLDGAATVSAEADAAWETLPDGGRALGALAQALDDDGHDPRKDQVAAPPAGELEPEAAAEAAAEAVHAMDREGRALEASRLLGKLCGDAHVSETMAARIRATARSVEEFEAKRRAASKERVGGEPAASASGWSKRVEGDLVIDYSYCASTGSVEVLGHYPMKMDALKLWALIHEFDLASGWLPNCKEARKLYSFARHRELYRVDLSPPVSLLSPMVMFQERSYFDLLNEHGYLMVVVESPDAGVDSWQGVELPPDGHGVRRIKQRLRNVVRPTASGETSLTWHLICETGIRHMPDWLVGKVASLSVGRLRASLDTVGARWASGGWEQRVASGPNAEYYRTLRQRIGAMRAGPSGVLVHPDATWSL